MMQFRFSLKILFVIVFLASLLCAYLGKRMRHAVQVARGAQSVIAAEGTVSDEDRYHDSGYGQTAEKIFGRYFFFDVIAAGVPSAAGLQQIDLLKDLKELRIGPAVLSSEDIRRIASLNRLEQLHMVQCDLRGADLSPLAELRKLTNVSFLDCDASRENEIQLDKLSVTIEFSMTDTRRPGQAKIKQRFGPKGSSFDERTMVFP